MTNNAPLSHALELGADKIYVLPTGSPCELDVTPHGALPMLLYAVGVLTGRRLVTDVASVPEDVELIVLPPPCPVSVQPIDFSQADSLIKQARQQARRYLDARRAAMPAADTPIAA